MNWITGVKEGPADCISMKKMKRQSPRFARASSRNETSTGDVGTQWMLDLCNGVMKEGCIPEDWKSSVVLPVPFYKGKVTQWIADPTEELNSWNML